MVKDAAYIIEEITTILEGTYFVITKKANKRRMCTCFGYRERIFTLSTGV